MKKCDVCGNSTFHNESVEEVFHLGQQMVLIENIPAQICDRCGDATFRRETVENIRKMIHGKRRPERQVKLNVFAYAG